MVAVVSIVLGLSLGAGALPLQDPTPPTREAVDGAVERGVAFLLAAQDEDGAWRYRDRVFSGSTALALFALIKCGVDVEHQAVQRGVANLMSQGRGGTYDTALTLMALEAIDPLDYRDWIAELAEGLIADQNRRGDWGYPNGEDLSNTQFAALGLLAAARAGVDVPAEVWASLVEGVWDYRCSTGGFAYSRGANNASDSMTAAGLGTLAICIERLARAGEEPPRTPEKLERELEAGLEELAEHFERAVSARRGPWPYYRLYAIERLGAFLGLQHIGEHDWYEAGAANVLAAQREDGSWAGSPSAGAAPFPPGVPGDPLAPGGGMEPRPDGRGEIRTAFALLFLRRATSLPGTGEALAASHAKRVFGTVSADDAVQVRATGQDPVTLWISGWSDATRARLEWPGETGRGPHVARVDYLVDGITVARIDSSALRPAEIERFATRHHFDRPGTYELRARVVVLAPEEGGTRAEVVESPPFSVDIVDAVPAWQREQAGDRARNLIARWLAEGRVRARASTTFEGGHGLPDGVAHAPELAVDNRSLTCWLADPEDADPTLTITFAKAVRANVLLIGAPRSVPYRPGFFSRPLTVEVTIDGQETHTVHMPPDERRKGRLELPRPRKIRRLELRIAWKVPGEGHPSTGLSDVELQLR